MKADLGLIGRKTVQKEFSEALKQRIDTVRKSKTIARLKAGEVVRICGLGFYIPPLLRHAAHSRFDCVWLDLEHRAMGTREVQALSASSQLFDIDLMIRPPTLEKQRLYRYLEDGASGLMIPHVSAAENMSASSSSVTSSTKSFS